jgi:hypothetical protein
MIFFASTVWRMLRSADACARLRPSAKASAKFANNTVKANQTAIGQRLHPQQKRRDRADIDHEHDRIAALQPGIEFFQGLYERGAQ